MIGWDLVPRVWGTELLASQFPLPEAVAVPATQGQGARPESHGRASTSNRDPPQCGAWVMPRPEPVAAAPGRGGSAEAKRAYTAPGRRKRGRVKGAVWQECATKAVRRDAE